MNDLQMEKKAIRASVLGARDAMPPDQRAGESIKMCESIIASTPYQRATTVLAYASFGSEFDTSFLLQRVLTDKKNLVMPRVTVLSRKRPVLIVGRVNQGRDI